MSESHSSSGPPPIQEHKSGIPLTSVDLQVLATSDADFHLLTWPDLQHIILKTNALEQLKRRPSDLKRYIAWSAETKAAYGSIISFVLRERLHWTPIDPSSPIPSFTHFNPVPFADERDYAVLRNDWPYGFVPGIVHIVVWTRTPIATDAGTGDVTEESRRVIEAFVQRKFVDRLREAGGAVQSVELGEMGRERVLWFKNWVSLQSVRGVDHVHVLVRDPPAEVMEEWLR